VISAQAAEYPEFSGETMALGRSTWLANCETCHAYGVAGAPLANDSQEWATRADKGVDTLYRHAIEGFFGPGGTMMPAKGANESLTDEEVTAAVDYMLRLASQSADE
jgi:cytochrome c5